MSEIKRYRVGTNRDGRCAAIENPMGDLVRVSEMDNHMKYWDTQFKDLCKIQSETIDQLREQLRNR
jgi:hypothetical protein